MPFEPGQSGNPAGRPRGAGSGRMQALGVLDQLLAEPGPQAALLEGLRTELARDPVAFFIRVVMPLLPKQAAQSMPSQEGGLPWRTLCDTDPTQDNN